MSIKVKITLFLLILFLTVIGNIFFTFQLEQYSNKKQKWINHTHEVIINTEDFLSAMQNLETGQRGYLLTENVNYLEPYHLGLVNARESFNTLYKKTLDNKSQTKRLVSIEILMKSKISELQETIKLVENGDLLGAIKLVKNDIGKNIMDKIRVIIKDFAYVETILLEKRKGEFLAHRSQLVTLIFVAMTFFIMMAIFTFLFLNKTLFYPMGLLLKNTHKMQKGEKIDVRDITSQDEMGYLLSSFFKMNEKVLLREENLNFIAHHDELTGLKNRVKVYDYIAKSIEKAKKENTKVSVLFIDLNKFKDINDTLGHEAGDVLLQEIASRFTSAVRSTDVVFRIGGDEFLILLENITDLLAVEKVIESILESIKTPVKYKNEKIQISVSIGIALYPDDALTSDELIKASDIAMYAAKRDKTLDYKHFEANMLKRSSD